MNPQVERLEALLARVQHNRKLPRAAARGVTVVESVAGTSQDASLDAIVEDAEIVAETPRVRDTEPDASTPILELEPHTPKVEARAPIDELDDPGTEPLPDLEPILELEPAAAPSAERDPFFSEPPPAPRPTPAPQPTPAPRRSPSESALAAAVQLAADEEPRTNRPAPGPLLDAPKPAARTLEVAPASPPAEPASPPAEPAAPPAEPAAPAAPAELAPVAVTPAPLAAPSGPVIKVAVAAPPATPLSFGELVRRSIALRPI